MTKELKFKAGVVKFDVKSGQIEVNLNTALGYLEKLASDSVNLAEIGRASCRERV